MSENRNLILALALSLGIFFLWETFIGGPQAEKQRHAAEERAAAQPSETVPAAPGAAPQHRAAAAPVVLPRSEALAKSARIAIDSPRLDGSIALTGAQFDDLRLKDYRETPDKKSPEIVLLSPRDTETAYYASFGWSSAAGGAGDLPGPETPWSVVSGTTLRPGAPVTLRWVNSHGVTFTRVLSLDDNYMFTIADTVKNGSESPVSMAPFALVARETSPPKRATSILHEGLIGAFNDEVEQKKYKQMMDKHEVQFAPDKPGGWVGITDKYWMSILIPDQSEKISARFLEQPVSGAGSDSVGLFQGDYVGQAQSLAPGATVSLTHHFFAGAKEVDVVDHYDASLHISKFSYAIDWGWFHFLTRPMFKLLDFYNKLVGNFGLAILLLTVTVKILFFPLANKSYESMSKMRKLQPEMTRLRDLHKEDKAKQQQELMALYQREKVNPFAGCLPVFVQIPVFFSLYKVLYVTIEMRQAPFYGWIKDLSAPDPTNLFTLFGLLHYDPTVVPLIGGLLHLGLWPLIMGVTMWLQMKMNPAPPDPTQAQIFAIMPFVFTFMLARFPAGLVIYWSWNNLLSMIQQYVIMRRMNVDIAFGKNFAPLLRFVRGITRRGAPKNSNDSAGQQPGE